MLTCAHMTVQDMLYVAGEGETSDPVPLEYVHDKVLEGSDILPTTEVWICGMDVWQPYSMCWEYLDARIEADNPPSAHW